MSSMSPRARRLRLLVASCAALAVLAASIDARAQSTPRGRGAAPATPRPATPRRGGAPPATPAKPAEVKRAEPVAPPDVRFRTVYTTGDQKTDTVMFVKGQRKRYEFQDMVLLDQKDLKRMVQVSPAAKTYMVIPTDGTMPGMPAMPAAPVAAPKPPGVVNVTTTITDTTERKMLFGRQARHVKTVMDMQPMPGACDATKQHIETDGWYIDIPPALVGQEAPKPPSQPQAQAACTDEIKATFNGDGKLLGYPVSYTTTMTGEDGKPVVAAMEVTELELTTLDAALFDVPMGFTAAGNPFDLSKALSDASEAKLAAADAAPPAFPPTKVAGVVRVGVPEFTNKTALQVDTRTLRANLIADLAQNKIEAVPMAAASPADLQKRAAELGYDYVLLADVAELKASKPGRLGGIMKAASGAAAARGGAGGAIAGAAGSAVGAPKENTEASLALKLLQPDGKQKMSTTTKGKDGGGFNLQAGLGLAKFAGGMYMSMMMPPQLFARLNGYGYGTGGLGGVGLLGNPALFRMQAGSLGLGNVASGAGVDATAGAASYLMQSALNMNQARTLVGMPGQGPSYDESLGEAVQNASKAVQKALQGK